jgi:DNA-binding transcriptional MerR regulator
MLIKELAQQSGVSAKTVRFYESVGLLPPPERAANNYRQYPPGAVKRLRFISNARRLGFSVRDIADFLATRQEGVWPCQRAGVALDQRLEEINQRIADLTALRDMLMRSRGEVAALPNTHACGAHCNCYLASPDEPPRATATGD